MGPSLLAWLAAAAVIVALVYAASHHEEKRPARWTLPPAGGRITIDQGPLSGMVITVADGAYSQATAFEVSTSPLPSHRFGPLFAPVTPVITVSDSGGFAAAPITVRIPVSTGADEVAAAFFLDRATGSLEGIPALARDATSLTIVTRHFSDVVVTRAKREDLEQALPVDSAFAPGRDDFAAPNFGSVAMPGGHCAGQSIAAIHYYNTHRGGPGLRLEPAVDDGPHEATPSLYWDDATGIRLCSLLQDAYASRWEQTADALRDVNEGLTYDTLLYAMALTREPQLILVYTAEYASGHAVVVYGMDRDRLWIADPNHPGDRRRSIAVHRTMDPENDRVVVTLDPYRSAPRADGRPTEYAWIAYYGIYALIDRPTVEAGWRTVLSGGDAGAALFPPKTSFLAYTGVDGDGRAAAAPLPPTLTVRRADLARVTSFYPGEDVLFVQADASALTNRTWYLGDREVAPKDYQNQDGRWAGIPLRPGRNDLGVCLHQHAGSSNDLRFDDFQRFTVVLEVDEAPPTEPLGAWVPIDFEVTGVEGIPAAFWDDVLVSNPTLTQTAWARWTISNQSAFFSSSANPDDTRFYHNEIRIGPPPAGTHPGWAGALLFQSNAIAAGTRNEHATLAAATRRNILRVTGWEAAGPARAASTRYQVDLSPADDDTLKGVGTLWFNSGGAPFTAAFTCALRRRSTSPRPEPVTFEP